MTKIKWDLHIPTVLMVGAIITGVVVGCLFWSFAILVGFLAGLTCGLFVSAKEV